MRSCTTALLMTLLILFPCQGMDKSHVISTKQLALGAGAVFSLGCLTVLCVPRCITAITGESCEARESRSMEAIIARNQVEFDAWFNQRHPALQKRILEAPGRDYNEKMCNILNKYNVRDRLRRRKLREIFAEKRKEHTNITESPRYASGPESDTEILISDPEGSWLIPISRAFWSISKDDLQIGVLLGRAYDKRMEALRGDGNKDEQKEGKS